MRGSRRGNAVMFAPMLSVLMGFGALSVDIGMMWLSKLELQQAIDNATLSGASELDGTITGIKRAWRTTEAIAAAHTVMGTQLSLSSDQIWVGTMDSGKFIQYMGEDPRAVNAVEVNGVTHKMPSGFGWFVFGVNEYTVKGGSQSQRRVAARRATESECRLPLALPDCHLAKVKPGTNPAPIKFTFSTPNTATTSAIAWMSPDGWPSSSNLQMELLDTCSGGTVSVDQQVYVSQSVYTSALETIRDVINGTGGADSTRWNTALYGPIPARPTQQNAISSRTTPTSTYSANSISDSEIDAIRWGEVIEGVVPLVDAGSDCSAIKFGRQMKVTGFAWALIYDVAIDSKTPNIYVQLDVANSHRSWGAGSTDKRILSNVLVPSPPEMTSW